MDEKVELITQKLDDIFKLNLEIPDYQRIYCWQEKNVIRLLEDIQNLEKEYRLGTIILQKKNHTTGSQIYDIIDGQQRLVTLSLILLALGDTSSPLLQKSFQSNEAYEHIAYNKYIISNYIQKLKNNFKVKDLLSNLTFNLLVLNDSSLDLAYTFFSNENSRGCPLSDFDLLKAHHLRYIVMDEQAKHLSTIWDKMLLEEQNISDKNEKSYERALGLFIFRLRKWLNYDSWDENEKYKVKNEYEAAKIFDEIPPFGEQFQFKEPIQGGSHFFAYVQIFINRFKNFKETKQYEILHSTMTGETHTWFRDVIESLLFAYYLKFGVEYLSEALILIICIISQARYENLRIHKETIFESARESKIVPLIDKSTSPTFFIAELVEREKMTPIASDLKGIRDRYSKIVKNISNKLSDTFILKNFMKTI